jgi:hypothetical protein
VNSYVFKSLTGSIATTLMTLGALTLILLPAFIHASWNLLNKRANGHVTFTVQDTAALLEVVAGADPRDHVTAPAHGKKPVPYRTYVGRKSLASKRLGIVREFMTEATSPTATASASPTKRSPT